MPAPIRTSALALALLLIPTVGCNTPDTVAAFCASASTTLASSTPVFEDLKASCLREVNSRSELGTFAVPNETDPDCKAIGDQAAGAEAAAAVLSDYYTAINSLASFGTAKVGGDAQTLASQAAGAFGVSSPVQDAVGSLAQFLVSAATSGYQQKSLAKDIPAASKHIAVVVNALVQILQENYLKQGLDQEEKKLASRYTEFAKGASPEFKLMLEDRWRKDQDKLNARRASAKSLIFALQAVSAGTTDLAANANHLKASEIPGLLQPYVTQLQTLIPQIQKAF